jgi:phage terminase large subunit-like protein
MFQYYEPKYLQSYNGVWYYNGNRLNVFAAIDFAFSLNKDADATSIVVVGVDSTHNYYILAIERFKTDRISEYYNHILKLYTKWNFRKIRAEITVAQKVIVKDLKENYIKPNGLILAVDDFRPTGNKEERIESTLQPRYANKQIWHVRGGNTDLLEQELVNRKPPHDDIKDSLAACIDIATPPAQSRRYVGPNGSNGPQVSFGGDYRRIYTHPRFGGF